MSKRTSKGRSIVDERSLKQPDKEALFYDESGTNQNDDDILSIDDQEWEDVPLDGSVSVTIDRRHSSNKRRGSKETKRKHYKYQKLKYGLHVTCIQPYLSVLQRRLNWLQDERLNRRLKRAVPTLISKKFKKWRARTDTGKLHNLRTITLGLIWWYRGNYQINSNGFRQNFFRVQYLLKYSDKNRHTKLYGTILKNDQWYYGSRPAGTDNIESIRQMAREKKANRDILTIFFLIMLRHLVSNEYQFSLCFALPLHDYEILCSDVKRQISNGAGKIPNKFDSDLLQPYFWIEMRCPDLDKFGIYVIDPIVHLKDAEIVARYRIDEPIHIFRPHIDMKVNLNQKFHFVASIDCQDGTLKDVSPRYLPNMCYRYFEPDPSSLVIKSLNYKAYCVYAGILKKLNSGKIDEKNNQLMRSIAFENWEIPKTLSEMKRSDCFVLKSQLKANEMIRARSQPVTDPLRSACFKEKVYWKCDALYLRCEQQWNQLGRSIIQGAKAAKLKKFISMKSRREKKLNLYEIRELFSVEQTIITPKLSTDAVDEFGHHFRITNVDLLKNSHGNIELYSSDLKPDGFELIPNQNRTKKLIKRYNRKCHKSQHIKYIDVVSGFDFKQKPGYAVPQIDHILLNSRDYALVQQLIENSNEIEALEYWSRLLAKLRIQASLDQRYGSASPP